MDCPDACSLEITVTGGVIEKIGARADHPTSRGFICSKVAAFARRVYHEDRLLHPLRRKGPKGEGDFDRISWDEAVSEITDGFHRILRESGGEAILPYHYGGSNGALTDGLADSVYFARLGTSRLAKTICAMPTFEVALGMYGRMPGVAFEDYAHAQCVILWGANPRASNIHLVPFLQEAKRRGAFVAVIDPRRNLSPDLVDLHIPVFPGTDLPLALALIRLWHEQGKLDREFLDGHAVGLDELLEEAAPWSIERAAAEARVSPSSIRRLADVYERSSPAVIRCGWGIERNRNGGQAVAAVLAIPALLGKFGVRGGGYTLSNRGAALVDRQSIWDESSWKTRIINMTQLGEVLNERENPIRGLFVYNSNPAATVPDQNAVVAGLSREDLFTVVFDQVMTDTARYADIVLPATTMLEQEDLVGSWGLHYVGLNPRAIAPLGEARSTSEVARLLAARLGFDDAVFRASDAELITLALAGSKAEREGASLEKLHADGFCRIGPPRGAAPFAEGGFPTASGKFEFVSESLATAGLGPLPVYVPPAESPVTDPERACRYPLRLLTLKRHHSINSSYGGLPVLRRAEPEPQLEIHPDDAGARRIQNGDRVRVWNDRGVVLYRAELTDRVMPGTVAVPFGHWVRDGASANTLTSDRLGDIGNGPTFCDVLVEVAAEPTPAS
jgi:anaerobic selenocysteine-containing dehydrogenase